MLNKPTKGFILWICLIAGVILPDGVRAGIHDGSTDQYRAITSRNVFGLRPQEPPQIQRPPPPPLRHIILTGITTFPGRKQALLKVEPLPGHSGEKEESLILAIGQREGEIEVLDIDEHAGSVTVNNEGTVVILSFQTNGKKPLAAAPTSLLAPALPN